MSKAVLISIRPEWCEKIAAGEFEVLVDAISTVLEFNGEKNNAENHD